MASSGVAIRFELAGIYDADYNQPSDYWQQAVDLMSNQQVMQQRDALRADMVSIYSTNPGLCGQARLTAKKSDAFSIISC
ncbi:peptidase M72 family protein, partial [Pseudomonas sp. SIMBA_067]